MNGIKFIEKYYNNLYNSESVRHSALGRNKYEDIQRYFDRLEDITIRAINNNKKELLYNYYFKKYCSKTSDKDILDTQKNSLRPWLDYLTNPNNKDPFWIKYYIFQGMVKIGTYNKETDTFNKRTNKTTYPFIEFNEFVVSKISDSLIDYVLDYLVERNIFMLIREGNFAKLYFYLLNQHKFNINTSKSGIWVKYNKGSKEDAHKLCHSLQGKNTFWCTSNMIYAINQLCGGKKYKAGDFYVYYTKDEFGNYTNPRIGIRFDGDDKISEIRGVLDSSQNLEPELSLIVKKKLDEFTFMSDLDKSFYLKAIDDNRRITSILKKMNKGSKLSQKDLDFIYEIDECIYSFGDGQDRRIHKIRENNLITDKEYLLKASKRNEDALQYASLELKNDKELVTKLIEGKYYLIDLVGEKLKNDKEFMMPILIKDPFYIRNAGSEIKRDLEIALYIIHVNPDLFRYLNVNLLKNKEFMDEASKIKGFTKKYVLNEEVWYNTEGDENENR